MGGGGRGGGGGEKQIINLNNVIATLNDIKIADVIKFNSITLT